jgi:hypothetical protein
VSDDEDWTETGLKYKAALEGVWRSWWAGMEEALWADPATVKPCAHEEMHIHEDGEWRCYFCQKPVPLTPAERTLRDARLAGATDPRERWCPKHDMPYEDDGGGPSSFSFCPSCRMERL